MAANKRRSNAGRSGSGPDRESPYLNIPWGNEQDGDYADWLSGPDAPLAAGAIDHCIQESLNIKIGTYGDSVFATIESPEAKKAETKYLISGWSDTWEDAVLVAWYKWTVLVLRDWEHPTAAIAKSHRR